MFLKKEHQVYKSWKLGFFPHAPKNGVINGQSEERRCRGVGDLGGSELDGARLFDGFACRKTQKASIFCVLEPSNSHLYL